MVRLTQSRHKVIEYTLFQPGLFLDYLAFPHKTSKHVDPLQTVFDFQNKRAIVVDGHKDAIMTLTTVADLADIVARAVDCKGKWPENGGIRGNRVTFSQIIEIGGRVRGAYQQTSACSLHNNDQTHSHETTTGRPFNVEKVQLDDLKAGELKTSWGLEAVHHAVSQDDAADLLKMVSIGILLSSTKGAWDVSDGLSQLFPDYQFTPIEDFLRNVWEGKID